MKSYEVGALANALRMNIEYEDLEGKHGRRRFLSAEEYLQINERRKGMHPVEERLAIAKNGLYTNINEEALVGMAREIMKMSCKGVVPDTSPPDQEVRSRRLRVKQTS